jgi:hypothetical protein
MPAAICRYRACGAAYPDWQLGASVVATTGEVVVQHAV